MNYQILLILNIAFLTEWHGMKIERHGVPVVLLRKNPGTGALTLPSHPSLYLYKCLEHIPVPYQRYWVVEKEE